MKRTSVLSFFCLALSGAEVLTQHHDLKRSGANRQETQLKPSNVNQSLFGKLFETPVDGLIYAQPLVASGLLFKGKRRDVVYVATAHNSLYAIDGDDGTVLWQRNFGRSMYTPNAFMAGTDNNLPYLDLTPEHGTVSTPVIDRATNTIYLTSFLQKDTRVAPFATFHHMLHALDLVNGADKFGSPVEMGGCIFSQQALDINAGHGAHHGRHKFNPQLCFDPLQHMQRTALTLIQPPGQRPQLILGFGSHGDYPVFHGWLMSYDATDLRKQLGLWVSSTNNMPEGTGAGIWQSGMGFPVDDDHNFYVMTGNGFSPQVDVANSLLRFTTAKNTIALADRYSPCSAWNILSNINDWDFGSSGPLLLDDAQLTPRPAMVIGGGKPGNLLLLDKNALGGLSKKCDDKTGFDPKVPQYFQAVHETSVHHFPHIHGTPIYYRSAARGPMIYVWGENDHLRAYPFVHRAGTGWRFNTFNKNPPSWAVSVATSPLEPWNEMDSMMTGGMLSISANGDQDGILWATTPFNNDANQKVVRGILHAYDATDLSKELWNSDQAPEDDLGNYAKFTPPTVVNGKVYMATFSKRLVVYGLRGKRMLPLLPADNLVGNHGFEHGTTGWTSNQAEFVGPNYNFRGKASALLCPVLLQGYGPHVCQTSNAGQSRDVKVEQTFQVAKTGRYRLLARCGTNILPHNVWLKPRSAPAPVAVTLSLYLDGVKVGTRVIEANNGYQDYEIPVAARAGQKVRVEFFAPQVEVTGPLPHKLIRPEAWAVIDDVQFHALPTLK